jgi:hypothetical protein
MSRIEPEERRLLEATVARLAADHSSIERRRAGDMVCPQAEW